MICILLCCSCRARYEIKINDNNVNDKLSITYLKEDEIIRSFAPNPLFALDNIQYDLNSSDTDNHINLNYTHSFDINDYSRAFIPNSCFSSFNFIKEDDKFYLMADGNFLCKHIANKYFDTLDIIIDTNHVVIQSNADEIKNGKYIWHVDPSKEEYSLKFVFSEKVKSNNYNIYFWGIVSIVGIGAIMIIKKSNRNEK